MKIGVLLSGSGVYDGSEIQEAVSVLIALDELGAEVMCLAPDAPQHHVVNHLNGEDIQPERNIRQESARIARGDVAALCDIDPTSLDGLVIPGGFGAAKNLCTWAFDGPEASVREDVKALIRSLVEAGTPIAALCVAPVVVAKALQGTDIHPTLTLGTAAGPSPYDIDGFHQGIESVGAVPVACELGDIVVDEVNRIITSPCYMMKASPAKILAGVRKACETLVSLASTSSTL